ncbi:MAG: GNAT family N-acetyltransferase [Thermoflexales bacterium]
MTVARARASGGFVIRESTADDAAAYREMRLEGLLAHPEAFGSDYAESATRPASHWLERVSYPHGRERNNLWFAAGPDGTLAGMLGIYTETMAKLRHVGTVVGVYTRPAWRRRGVADALLGQAIAWAGAAGFRRLRLAVVTTNAAAIRAYARAGFTVYGLEPAVISTGGAYYDELLMGRAVL